MKILLDECLPKKSANSLKDFDVKTVSYMGWKSFTNGVLLKLAIENGFDYPFTIDKNLEYQQNLKLFNITVITFDVNKC